VTVYPDAARRFQHDVEQHAMTVLHDVGLYRHLRFQRPDRMEYWFDLVTWPGYLAITGDMGSFTFTRLRDMVEFFAGAGDINPGYWAEKIQAGKGDTEEYAPERFRALVHDAFGEHVADNSGTAGLDDLWQAITSEVLPHADERCRAYDALSAFEHQGFTFADAWEWHLDRWTYHYLWCCFAIRWGVQLYLGKPWAPPGDLTASAPAAPASLPALAEANRSAVATVPALERYL